MGKSLAFTHLRRALGLWDAVGIGLGAMVGAGIYVLIGIGAGLAGPALFFSFLVAGGLALLCALSMSQLAAAIPLSGATYEYAHERINPTTGFLSGLLFIASKILESATVALALGAYLAFAIPSIPAAIPALLVIAAFTALNYRGIRASSRALNIMVVVKMIALALLVIFSLAAIRFENFTPFAPQGGLGILQGAALLFFAFTGFARTATLGEEVRQPRKNIPKAIFLALGIAAVAYVLVSTAAVGVAGAESLSKADAPLAFVAGMLQIPGLVGALVLGGLVATASVLLGDLLAVSRTLFAMGRNRDLPAALGMVHDEFGSPHTAVIAAGVIAGLLVLSQSLAGLALFTSLTILLYYAVTNYAALFGLRGKERHFPKLVSLGGFGGCLVLAFFIPAQYWLYTIGLLVLGLLYYRFARVSRKR